MRNSKIVQILFIIILKSKKTNVLPLYTPTLTNRKAVSLSRQGFSRAAIPRLRRRHLLLHFPEVGKLHQSSPNAGYLAVAGWIHISSKATLSQHAMAIFNPMKPTDISSLQCWPWATTPSRHASYHFRAAYYGSRNTISDYQYAWLAPVPELEFLSYKGGVRCLLYFLLPSALHSSSIFRRVRPFGCCHQSRSQHGSPEIQLRCWSDLGLGLHCQRRGFQCWSNCGGQWYQLLCLAGSRVHN